MQQFTGTVAVRRLVAVVATTAAMACGSSDSPNAPVDMLAPYPVAATNATIIVTGNAQTVARGQASAPLVVRVVTPTGNPVANTAVTWSILNGGTLSATSTTTNANGETQVTVTAGSTTRAYTVTAAAAGSTAATIFLYVP